jgi:predicted O-methyltransferase YrrM
VHRYPVDCYRFYPDSFQAIADWSELCLVHSWTDERGPWCDIVGVFQKGRSFEQVVHPQPRRIVVNDQIAPHPDTAAEQRQGSRFYLEVLRDLHEMIQPHLYLEIGVRQGFSLSLARGSAVGIDPDPHPDLQLANPEARLFRCTSDDFFFFHSKHALAGPAQLAFIDGMHLAEFVLRDFMNVERCMSAEGVIVIDDVLPNHPVQARRERGSQVWTGDVWRFAERLAELRPKLRLTWLDTDPSGLLVISGLNPADRTLWSDYNQIARRLEEERDSNPPAHLIDRSRALQPTTQNIRKAAGR